MSEIETPAPGSGKHPGDRMLDVEGLKGLSHPLRVRIFDRLSVHGACTASTLAAALGESTGATSYHLRQLERHGFVREVPGMGTGRERWWERVPGGISLDIADDHVSESAKAAGEMLLRQWERNRSELLEEFYARGEELGRDWMNASVVSTANLRLTLDQAKEVHDILERTVGDIVDRFRGRNDPGSRPVQMHMNLFPVVSGQVTPDESSNDGGRA